MKNSSGSSKQKNRKIIAGLPAFNEEQYIGTVVLKTRQYADEVIIVDDGSTDRTAEVATLAGAEVIQHKKNLGYGAGVQSLLAEAKKRGATAFVLLSANFRYNPDEIPDLMQPLSEGFDIVIGSRTSREKNPSRDSAVKRTVDSESGFIVFSQKALNSISLKDSGAEISAEIISQSAEKGLRLTGRPVSVRYTRNGSAFDSDTRGTGFLHRIIDKVSGKPLLFFGTSGIVLILAGVIAGCMALGIVFSGGGAVTGWAILSVLLLIIGAFSFFTGIILNVFLAPRD